MPECVTWGDFKRALAELERECHLEDDTPMGYLELEWYARVLMADGDVIAEVFQPAK